MVVMVWPISLLSLYAGTTAAIRHPWYISTHPGRVPDSGDDLEADPQGGQPVRPGDRRFPALAHALHEVAQLVHQRLAVLRQVWDLDEAALPVAHAAVGQELRVLDAVHLDLLAEQVGDDRVVPLGQGDPADLALADPARRDVG